MSDAWTIKRLLDWTTGFFRDQGADQPRLDAEILLAESLGCQRIELYTRFDEVISEDERGQYRQWVQRHGEGEPVAYLVGHREFFSLDFLVNRHVLIPRPETEHLVLATLDIIKTHFPDTSPVHICDVGTGSGCVAIALAKHCAQAEVQAVDISGSALEVARRNVDRHQVSDRVSVSESNLLDTVDCDSLHIIVSNPPYIGQSERDSLPASVRDFEPETALFADDPAGLSLSQRLVDQLIERCPAGCWVLMETSPMNAGALAQYFQAKNLQSVTIQKDLANLDRIVIGCRS